MHRTFTPLRSTRGNIVLHRQHHILNFSQRGADRVARREPRRRWSQGDGGARTAVDDHAGTGPGQGVAKRAQLLGAGVSGHRDRHLQAAHLLRHRGRRDARARAIRARLPGASRAAAEPCSAAAAAPSANTRSMSGAGVTPPMELGPTLSHRRSPRRACRPLCRRASPTCPPISRRPLVDHRTAGVDNDQILAGPERPIDAEDLDVDDSTYSPSRTVGGVERRLTYRFFFLIADYDALLIALRKAAPSSQNRAFVVFFRCGRVLVPNKLARKLVPISSWTQPPICVLLPMLFGSLPRRSSLVVISAGIPATVNSFKTISRNARSSPQSELCRRAVFPTLWLVHPSSHASKCNVERSALAP